MNPEIKPVSDVDKLKLVVFGDEEAKIVGLLVRTDELESWRNSIDDERIKYKSYFAGAAVGLGINLLFTIVAVAKLFGWL